MSGFGAAANGRCAFSAGTLYITGGRNKKNAQRLREYEGFEKAMIGAVSNSGTYLGTVAEYVSPADACPPVSSILFKAGNRVDDRLYVCTQTEVLIYRVPEFVLMNSISLPIFNDVHHVMPRPDGSMFVASTGLDAVFEISEGGDVLRHWDLLGGDLWQRFDKGIDYRRVPTTKPHLVHPNYVFRHGEEVWVTRLEQRDALRLIPSPARIPIEVERPHDGVIFDGKVYFTTIDSHIVRTDPLSCTVEAVFDLQESYRIDYPLGWCRGLKVLDHDRVIVGFTRLRPTLVYDNVRWVSQKLKRATGIEVNRDWTPLATRISCIDLSQSRVLWETDLEPYGINAVFSIL